MYFDTAVNFAGFQIEERSFHHKSELGQRNDQVSMQLPSNLIHLPGSRVVGFRTTKACKEADTLDSVQVIYLSNDPWLC